MDWMVDGYLSQVQYQWNAIALATMRFPSVDPLSGC